MLAMFISSNPVSESLAKEISPSRLNPPTVRFKPVPVTENPVVVIARLTAPEIEKPLSPVLTPTVPLAVPVIPPEATEKSAAPPVT